MDLCGVRPLSYLCHRDYSPLGNGGHRKSKQAHLDKRVTRVTGCFPFNSSADSYMHQAMCPQHRPTSFSMMCGLQGWIAYCMFGKSSGFGCQSHDFYKIFAPKAEWLVPPERHPFWTYRCGQIVAPHGSPLFINELDRAGYDPI